MKFIASFCAVAAFGFGVAFAIVPTSLNQVSQAASQQVSPVLVSSPVQLAHRASGRLEVQIAHRASGRLEIQLAHRASGRIDAQLV